MSHGALVALDIAGPGTGWGELGLMVADEVTQVGEVTLRFGHEGEGIVGWALRGPVGPPDLDGLPTIWLPEPVEPSAPREHRLGFHSIDHVVIATPDPRRTFACFESAGLELRRERETGSEQRPQVQGFFRHGEATIEVVGPREPSDDGPATFWGLTLMVDPLDAAVAALGPRALRRAPRRGPAGPPHRDPAARRGPDDPRGAHLTGSLRAAAAGSEPGRVADRVARGAAHLAAPAGAGDAAARGVVPATADHQEHVPRVGVDRHVAAGTGEP